MAGFSIRFAKPADVGTILFLVRELAEFGGDLAYVTATEDDLRNCFFGPAPSAEILVAEVDQTIIAHAVFYRTNSTYAGKQGLFLEDLYVTPTHRGRGIGKAIFLKIAAIASERGYCKVEWKAYDWNTKAVDFYLSLGAKALSEQTPYRLNKEAIETLCASPTRQA